VTWSGDKLLGGPQAGIIHGRAAVVDRLRDNPLARAFRVDKMTLAALEATLRLYLSPELATTGIPVLRMLVTPLESVTERARAALSDLTAEAAGQVTVVPMRSVLGGGTAPGFELPSAGWILSGSAEAHESSLRTFDPPVVGRIEGRKLRLDFRTVLEGQEATVAAAVNRLVREEQGDS
jgi:L-seryl-tRNA(Ser) seleniumtransferase